MQRPSDLAARHIARGLTVLVVLLGIGFVASVAWAVVGRATGGSSPVAPKAGQKYTDAEGFVHSGAVGTGEYRTTSLHIAPRHGSTRHTYTVRVENGTGIDVDKAAREIQVILDDPRGWAGTKGPKTRGAAFELVPSSKNPEMTITIATPPTVDATCPLDTVGLWSCDDGKHVLLNSDRWHFRTPIYDDTADYRAYMVNHEVGHFLGLDHSPCAGAGRLAPVMMQQSKGLQGCRANAWPTRTA